MKQTHIYMQPIKVSQCECPIMAVNDNLTVEEKTQACDFWNEWLNSVLNSIRDRNNTVYSDVIYLEDYL